jgi:hypothetical protein
MFPFCDSKDIIPIYDYRKAMNFKCCIDRCYNMKPDQAMLEIVILLFVRR